MLARSTVPMLEWPIQEREMKTQVPSISYSNIFKSFYSFFFLNSKLGYTWMNWYVIQQNRLQKTLLIGVDNMTEGHFFFNKSELVNFHQCPYFPMVSQMSYTSSNNTSSSDILDSGLHVSAEKK